MVSVPALAVPADTARRQREASDPAASAWVSANAGSGKTFVLTRRVIRLLLDGVPPGRILCLTFTKAAAANMAVKVFDTLAGWVTLDDATLAARIKETGAPQPGAEGLARARRLFARTVESPGGLKILTIHAFCERLLHGFPFEANVAARFGVIEEVQQAELLSRAREAALARAVADPDSRLGRALDLLGRTLTGGSFEELVGEVTRHADALREAMRGAGGLMGLQDRLARALDVAGITVASVESAMLEDGLPTAEWGEIARRIGADGGTKNTAGNRLARAAATFGDDRLARYLSVFLTAKLEPLAESFLPKTVRAKEPGLCATLDAERGRLVTLLAKRRAVETQERTAALLSVADAVLSQYETLKRARGSLDFADLIERSRTLLSRSDSAWVLFKLDQGIEHVLVDEAQDTSPGQWDILKAISRDFFAGEGQSRALRTFFAVGDKKQSIYAFQGARPAAFDQSRQHFADRASDADLAFADIQLVLSFRSARRVLEVVDRVFAAGDNARGLTARADRPPPHEPLKTALPGLVEVWEPVGPALAPDPASWALPVDVPDAADPAVVLARRVADRIRALTAPGSPDTVEDTGSRSRRPVRAGDVLILVRSRNAFFDAVIRALKERHVPVAGADRLSLTGHIAVMDLVAAGRAALLPDDDLTLACALKSPLLGLDDSDLMVLAPRRAGSLAAALDASGERRHRAAADRLAVWRDRATTLTPFAFYTRLLGRDGGRRALLSRLGPEAGDVVDEFMALTLAHERDGAPSLLAFLARLEGTEVSVKRDMEHAGDAVRVMTVHAAKGLEAKIVFLPDTCGAPTGRHDPKLFRLERPEGDLFAWSPRADADPGLVAQARGAGRDAALDEHRRLLYVALTRAEERLYIAGFHGVKGPQAECWYEMVRRADLGLEPAPAPWDAEATVLRRADAVPGANEAAPTGDAAPEPPVLPDWIHRAAPRETPAAPPIRPSTALGAADRFDAVDAAPEDDRGRTRREAAAAGRLLHTLLQHLPGLDPAHRRDAARRFVGGRAGGLAPERRGALIEDALRIVADPALAPLFGPDSRAEVPLAARLPNGDGAPLEVTGQIDRLAVTDEAVFIADFKTGTSRDAADAPPSYVAQLALYRAAVQPLYPDRPVRAFLVWTAGPVATEIPSRALDAALDQVRAASQGVLLPHVGEGARQGG